MKILPCSGESGTEIEAAHIPKLVANKAAATANKPILHI
jgi:hypothetical protein